MGELLGLRVQLINSTYDWWAPTTWDKWYIEGPVIKVEKNGTLQCTYPLTSVIYIRALKHREM